MRQPSRVPSTAVDPRVSRTRAAVVRAATDLLVEGGPYAVTIDAIVARSGVAKSTIYRHWESRDDVLLTVIETCAPRFVEPDPDGDVIASLREVVHSVVASLNDPEWARTLPALLMLKNHEAGIKAIDERLEHEQDMVVTTLIERAVKEGVLESGIEVPEAITHLLGPLLFAHLTESVAVDAAFADRTLDRFLAAYAP
jgi:AcrR family transcriptional regulator